VRKTSIVRGADGKRLTLRHNPLAVACAAAFLIASQGAWAADETAPAAADAPQGAAAADATTQTAAEKEEARRKDQAKKLQSVKVVGIRTGIENAIDNKQDNTSIVETISAEDIGKLPDSSIAESIARLPGLTAQRERGRATQINIRGFAGDFAGTTLNGREQTSTGDNRGVEFDQYPSELLSGVTVYKTADASLVGQGLSGTVDMHTVRPLDFTERVLSFNFRGDQNKVNGENEYGNRYSFAYIDQFADNRLGISIGYAHLDSPQPGFQNESWGYADGPNGTKVYGGGKLYKFDDNMERDGWMGTLQWKPNDWYEGTVDLFYSQFKKTEVKTGVEFGTQWGQGILQPGYTVNGNGTITSSDWTNVKPVLRMDSNPIEDELVSWGWNNKFKVNDHWSIDADISFSRTNRDFDVLETYAGLTGGSPSGGGGVTNAHVELDPSGDFYNVTFARDLNDPSQLQLIDAGGWGQDGYLKAFEVNDRLWAYRVDAERKFDTGWLSSIEFGVNFTDRDKHKSSDEAKLCIVACANNIDHLPFPGSPGDFGFGGLDGLATYDAEQILTDGSTYNLQPKFHPDIANKNWSISENLSTVYAQFNIDTDIGDMPLRGNFGFQYVSVDQSSEGFSTFQGNDAGDITSDGDKYHDFLPSLNLNLGMKWDMYLRLGIARQMARPRLDDLRASFNVSINTATCAGISDVIWCGSGGNPRLRPWLSNSYDLSWEKYFTTDSGNKGYVAAAYWFKDLQTYIYKADIPFDYAGFPLPPDDGNPNTAYPDSTVGVLNQPFNGEGGTMKGIELTASLPLDVLWDGLNGFGLQASYSDTTSSIEPFGPGSSQPLPGLSKYVSNITAYWERWGFSVRLSQRTRSQFLGETRGFGADLAYILINGETVRDAQMNYNFQPGSMLEGLSLYLQVSNIGDEPFTTSDAGDPDARPIQYFEYGRTTLLGFSYKF
jgi:iron complex outermembrane receptor protein